MATNTIVNGVSNVTGGSYTPAQVASINSARATNVANGVSAYSGAGATANSEATGQTGNGTGIPLYAAPTTINSTNTAPTTPIQIPTPPTPSNAGTQAMTAISGTATAPAATTSTDGSTDPAETAFQTYLKNIQAPPDTATIYQNDLNASGVTADQQAVNNYQSQLNAITANASAAKLSLVGQGNGVPNAIIGGQQAEIDREAAIQALPISAQLTAAQGDLTTAQDNVDTLFKLQAADAQNQVTYQNSLVTAVYNFATSEQKTQLDALTAANNQAFTTQQNDLNYAQSQSTLAIQNGQPTLAAQIMKLDPTDPNYRTNVATLAGGIQVQKSAPAVSIADQKTEALASLSDFVQSNNNGTPLSYGPVVDSNGDITPAALKAMLAAAPGLNLTASEVLQSVAPNLYSTDGVVSSNYGLNAAELKLVNAGT